MWRHKRLCQQQSEVIHTSTNNFKGSCCGLLQGCPAATPRWAVKHSMLLVACKEAYCNFTGFSFVCNVISRYSTSRIKIFVCEKKFRDVSRSRVVNVVCTRNVHIALLKSHAHTVADPQKVWNRSFLAVDQRNPVSGTGPVPTLK